MNNLKLLLLFVFIIISACANRERKTIKEPTSFQENQTDLKTYNGKDYLIDDLHSYIGFKIKYFGFSPVRGRFNEFDGTIFYDPEAPEEFSTSIVLDIRSINTANEMRDDDLKKEGGWFDAPNFPTAKFTSSGVFLHENGFYLFGDLTIKGITKQIKIDVDKPLDISRDSFMNEQFSLYGTFSISRKEFGVIGGDFWTTTMENGLMQLSDEVEMEIELHCRRTDYDERYKELEDTNVRKIIIDKITETNIEEGLKLIDSFHANEEVSSGVLSTVGYILIEWGYEQEALEVFSKKKELFGDSAVLQNQMGITYLSLDEAGKATQSFQKAIKLDSTNSRSIEYLKLLSQ